jgi:hypothetical protein
VNNSCDDHICSLFAHELGHVARYWRRCKKPCPMACPRPCNNCERFAHRYAAKLGFPRVRVLDRLKKATVFGNTGPNDADRSSGQTIDTRVGHDH